METALAAVLGYVRGKRPLWFRSPSRPDGSWVQVAAFGYERYDRAPRPPGLPGDADVLVAEGLHGRLDRPGWAAVRQVVQAVAGLVDAAAARAGGRPLHDLPAEEFSVLAEPGTVGAALRDARARAAQAGPRVPDYVTAAFHHRHPELVPHLDTTTRRQLWPHLREGDSGPEAVVHRELTANAAAFTALETSVAGLIGARIPRLRLHDVLLWLAGSLRMRTAVEWGRATDEWSRRSASGTATLIG
jgi:hypothetical protein